MRELVKEAAALIDADKLDEGMDLLYRVLWNEPDNAKACYIAGSAMMKAGRNVQALQMLKRAVEISPKTAEAWSQLCHCCGEMHLYDDAIRYAQRALELKRTAATLADMAYAYVACGYYDEADKFSREALKLDPANVDALQHQGVINLGWQNWALGWKGYEVTERTKYRKQYQYGNTTEWEGEPDQVVMVTTEQGLGDEIMFVGMVPDAAKRCRKFILDCDHRLFRLYQRSFPDVLVTPTRRETTVTLPIAPTRHKVLAALGEIVRQKSEDFPRVAYLKANPDYVAMFRALFASWGDKPVIGIAWSGGLPRTGKAERTAGLNAFLPLLRRGDAEWVSLQYKDDLEEINDFERQHGIRVRRLPWVAQMPDMDLLGGMVAAMDEVIGVHTTALHLSSALGTPTTILTHRGSGWRYFPQELLWYPPTTQMVKKQTGEGWREVVARLVEMRKGKVKLAA